MKEKIFSRNFCTSFLALFSLGMVMYMLMGTLEEYTTAFGATVLLGGVATLCGENYRVIYYAGAVLSLVTFAVYYFAWGRKGDTAHWRRTVSRPNAAQELHGASAD